MAPTSRITSAPRQAALSPRRLRASSRDGVGVVNRPPSPLTMLLSRLSRRRDVIALLTGVAASPSPAASERSGAPAIGFLSSRSPEESAKLVEAFVSGLREGGFVDGRDLRVAYRWARGHLDDLPALAAELVREPVAVLVAA